MRGSLRLFTWFGIPVHLHWSFGLIFLYAFWIGYENNLDMIGTAWLMGFFVALFGCVLLHEYGHALTARRYGIDTHDIILTPIGGIARLEKMPEKPSQEFVVAIAGPMVNVAIALLLVGVSMLVFRAEQWEFFKWFLQQQYSFTEGDETAQVMEETGLQPSGLLFYLPVLVATNIGLVIFNLIPAFPMDGGRIFRSLLAMRWGRVKATRWAAWLGQGIAVLFIVYGLWSNAFTLALVGLFVFTTARSENSMVQLDDFLRKYRAKDLLRPQFTRIYMNDWMQSAAELLQKGLERHFLVFDLSEQLVGMLDEASIVAAMKKNDLGKEVSQYAQKVEIVHLNESLQHIFFLIRNQGNAIVAVGDENGLLGVIDEAGLYNFMRMQSGKSV
ncbi:MAG: site-2 protease family protein [Saprospiraceae bacterium]|nr:site-2 protease family protein [Saprospiraceae bacterium]MCC6283496.1 site-2 protease family protein [Saprospiraceae bacterium]